MKTVFNPKSKTHLATATTAIAGSLLTFLPTVQAYYPPEYYGPTIIGLGVGFHVLRNVTTKPISEK